MEAHLAAVGFFKESTGRAVIEAEALTGGLQNTNYKVTTASGEVFVVRIPASDAREHGQGTAAQQRAQ